MLKRCKRKKGIKQAFEGKRYLTIMLRNISLWWSVVIVETQVRTLPAISRNWE